jgi:hypothetical protein
MQALCLLLLAASSVCGAPPGGSFLLVPAGSGDGRVFVEPIPYEPHEGDLVLFDDHSKNWRALYHFVGSDVPDHSGIVVKLPDGRPALLESGPDDGKPCGLQVVILEAYSRLHQCTSTMYIRHLRCPLTPAQSQALTDFALAQSGKRYAVGRLLLQGTPCRCRCGVRARLFGHTYMDRDAWLCSELVVAAGTAAGLFDPHVHFANRIYPLDLFDERTYPDLIERWWPVAVWSPTLTDTLPPDANLLMRPPEQSCDYLRFHCLTGLFGEGSVAR